MTRTVPLAALLLATSAVADPSSRGMVSAADPRAAEAGREILRAGGSAADAAMATMLALTVVEPQSSGIGGGGYFVYHDAKTGQIATVDGRETAPASATPQRFTLPDGQPMPFIQAVPGGLSVGIPGNMALMARVHARWGKLPWAALFQPAIRLASAGYTVSPRQAGMLAMSADHWADFPATRAIYWHDGAPAKAGDTIHNPALAETLTLLAKGGADAFYRGFNARLIEQAVATAPTNKAVITDADLAGYRAKDRAPVCGSYRGYRICSMAPSSSGGVTILMMLGMLEHFDLAKLGPDSPVSWHLIGEAMRLAYADRDTWLGDTDFVRAPVAGLLDPAYLRGRAALIHIDRTLGTYQPGAPAGADPRTHGVPGERGGTTHFVTADKAGDVATMTSTVEGYFGSQLVAGGYVLNNELTDFSFSPEKDGAPVANRVEAGKRPLSSMSPTIVYDAKGHVVLAVGSAGGRQIIMHVLRALVGTLDWKLSAQGAIDLPNLFFNGDALVVEQGSTLDAMRPALARLGETVQPAALTSKLNAIEWTKAGWRGAADKRSEGVSLAE